MNRIRYIGQIQRQSYELGRHVVCYCNELRAGHKLDASFSRSIPMTEIGSVSIKVYRQKPKACNSGGKCVADGRARQVWNLGKWKFLSWATDAVSASDDRDGPVERRASGA